MNNISKEIKFLVVAFIALSTFFFSNSALGFGFSFFGGTITSVVQCTCPGSPGSQVTITGLGRNSQFSGTYLDSPGETMAFGKDNVDSGKNILGGYTPGGECLMAGDPCTILPITQGTMTRIGTN